MADRLAEIEARVESVRQLSAVITAMRGIAAVRSHEAKARLAGIRAYADTMGAAISEALALLRGADKPRPKHETGHKRIIITLCSEQGFVGGFNTHILDMTGSAMAAAPGAILMLLGDRGITLAKERGLNIDWSASMIAHVDQVVLLANRLADQLFDLMQDGSVQEVSVIHTQPSDGAKPAGVVSRRLIPFDFTRFPSVHQGQPPMTHLPAHQLLARLADEYVFAEMCEALTLSYAAENEARMRAMVAAKENVAHKFDELSAQSRLMRQQQITDEVLELAVGAESGTS